MIFNARLLFIILYTFQLCPACGLTPDPLTVIPIPVANGSGLKGSVIIMAHDPGAGVEHVEAGVLYFNSLGNRPTSN